MSTSSKLFSSDDKRHRTIEEKNDSTIGGNHLRLNAFSPARSSNGRSSNRAGSPLTAIHGTHIPSLTKRMSGMSHSNSRQFGRYQNSSRRTSQISQKSPLLQSNNAANNNNHNNSNHHNTKGNGNGNINNSNVQSNRLTTVSTIIGDGSPVNNTINVTNHSSSSSSSVYQTHRRRSRFSPAVLFCFVLFCLFVVWRHCFVIFSWSFFFVLLFVGDNTAPIFGKSFIRGYV